MKKLGKIVIADFVCPLPETRKLFNPDYLIDGLDVMNTEEICLETTDALKPAILKGVDEDSFLYLLMPVRVS